VWLCRLVNSHKWVDLGASSAQGERAYRCTRFGTRRYGQLRSRYVGEVHGVGDSVEERTGKRR
jgi:hypothetical protein